MHCMQLKSRCLVVPRGIPSFPSSNVGFDVKKKKKKGGESIHEKKEKRKKEKIIIKPGGQWATPNHWLRGYRELSEIEPPGDTCVIMIGC